jgi:hypothetical protein
VTAQESKSSVPSGSWTHSFEEDEGSILVYRPTDRFAFPPARGRETLHFRGSGELLRQIPGPNDRHIERADHWAALSGNRLGVGGMPGAPENVYEILESGPDILKLRRQ